LPLPQPTCAVVITVAGPPLLSVQHDVVQIFLAGAGKLVLHFAPLFCIVLYLWTQCKDVWPAFGREQGFFVARSLIHVTYRYFKEIFCTDERRNFQFHPRSGLVTPAGEARHERRHCARHGRGGGPGVVLEEEEDHDDVPAKVDDADEDDQVDDLA
jgi:hypothetical protein